MKWKCKEDPFMNGTKTQVFTKESEYEDLGDQKFERDPTVVEFRDDQNVLHTVSEEWLSNFEKIEENV